MITAEAFVLLKLFTENIVSWWWIVAFIISDGIMWGALRGLLKSEEKK